MRGCCELSLTRRFREHLPRSPLPPSKSTHGDFVAQFLYEDLLAIGKSEAYDRRVKQRQRVVNVQNRRRGVAARRGDGTLGELIPDADPIEDAGYQVARGPVATVEIGIEGKILAKAMIKQIDRVIGDCGYQHCKGRRAFRTDGKKHKHPCQEAVQAEAHLKEKAQPKFDEFLFLRYRATNSKPYDFEWVDRRATELDYGAILTRISREYDRRFR